jgi:predicted nucleotidyltransferase
VGDPHGSDEHRAVGLGNEILRVLVGSGLHGTAIEGQDDRDEMGICVEPPEYVIGLGEFEQYIYRTQPEGARSGPGDLDLVVYGLRKWTRLAMQGNPTVLLPLFVPEEHVVVSSELGRELRAMAGAIVSRQAAPRFLGYLAAQRDKLLGRRSGAGRPELIERYGFDAKFAMHMVRLGVQGVELLETGRITLPMPEPWLSWCRALRRGERSEHEALEAAAELELRLRALETTSPLPPAPDRARLDAWLVATYRRAWADRSLLSPAAGGPG